MKYLIIALVALVGFWFVMSFGTTEYYEPIEQVEEVIEAPTIPLEWLEEAEEAKQRVLEKKQLEHDRDTLQLKLDVLEVQSKELEEEIKEIDKTLGVYWQDRNNVVAYIREVFYDTPNTAIAVAFAESGLRMVQSNHKYKTGEQEQSFGVFQIHAKAWDAEAKRIGLPDYRTDVEQNIKMARHIYEASGWSAWSVYKDGSYKLAMR